MRIAIIGGGCPFGLNLARYLLGRNHAVIGIGRTAIKPADVQGRYHVMHIGTQLDTVMVVLDDFQPDVIVNFAALGERAASLDPSTCWLFYQTNVVALARLQGKLAQRDYLKRFIQISSGEVYGSTDSPLDETASLYPTTPYAASKAAFDLHLTAVWKSQRFPMNILRPCNLYCEGQQPYRIVPKAFLAALTGTRIPLNGGGMGMKTYMHATDLSCAVETVMERAPFGEIYNVAPDHHQPLSFLNHAAGPITIRDLCAMIASTCGVSLGDMTEDAPAREATDAKYWFRSRKLQALGWLPTISLKKGLAAMREWVAANKDTLAASSQHYRLKA